MRPQSKLGEHKVAIAWDQLRFDRHVAMVNLTKDQLRAMPESRASRTTPPNRNAPNPAPAPRQP